MRLQAELALSQVRLLGVKILPTKEDPIVTLAFRTALTRDVAEAFGVRDLVYAGNVPRSGVDKMTLEGEEQDAEVHFQHDRVAFTAVASSVGHFVATLEGEGAQLAFQVKLSSYAATAAELIEKIRIDPFSLTLKPNQMDLELKDEPTAQPIVDESQRLISPEQAADMAPAADGQSLAPAAVMGGTHQKGGKKKRSAPEMAPVEEPDPFSEVVQ